MKHPLIHCAVLSAAAMILAGCGGGSDIPASTIPASYTVTDIDASLPNENTGSVFNQPKTLNNSGQIVGTTLDNGPAISYLYSNGVYQDISKPTGVGTNVFEATDLNNKGQIVGVTTNSNGQGGHTLVLNQNNVTDITTVTGNSNFSGSVIGDTGEIAGTMNASLAIVKNNTIQNLGSLPGFSQMSAVSINSAGQIVGSANNFTNAAISQRRAFLYSTGHIVDLGTLPGYSDSEAISINNSARIVGASGNTTTDFQYANLNYFTVCHAFVSMGGSMTDLGTLPGDDSSIAISINSSGQIVGASGGIQHFTLPNGTVATSFGFVHAFIYSQGKMVDLNTLLPKGSNIKLSRALSINDQGQILALGNNGNLSTAFLLTPKS